MEHLTAERHARLLARPKDEPELYAHLQSGCEVCEAFLAAHDGGLLGGAADAALLKVAPRSIAADPRAEATYQRIRAAVKPAGMPRWALALAAMLLAVVATAVLLMRPGADDGGLKGPEVVTVELQAVVKSPEGALTRVEPRQTVPGTGTLLIRYHASDAAKGSLVVVRGGKRETLGTVELRAGTHDLTRDGALLGVSLEGEHGPLKVRLETVSSVAELELNVGP